MGHSCTGRARIAILGTCVRPVFQQYVTHEPFPYPCSIEATRTGERTNMECNTLNCMHWNTAAFFSSSDACNVTCVLSTLCHCTIKWERNSMQNDDHTNCAGTCISHLVHSSWTSPSWEQMNSEKMVLKWKGVIFIGLANEFTAGILKRN